MFKAGSAAFAEALDPVALPRTATRDPARYQLREYLAGIIADRRAWPRDDLVTRLVEAEEEGERLDADQGSAGSLGCGARGGRPGQIAIAGPVRRFPPSGRLKSRLRRPLAR
jgi:hypothetical protein